MAYVVDKDKCIGCKICEKVCPVNAITMIGKKAKIDPTLCTDCGICAERCPVGAISPGARESISVNPPPQFYGGIYGRRGFGMGRHGGRGMGRGRGQGGGLGRGPSGYCVCPACGTRVPHEPGIPCTTMKCPKCGATMVRE